MHKRDIQKEGKCLPTGMDDYRPIHPKQMTNVSPPTFFCLLTHQAFNENQIYARDLCCLER